MWPAFCYLYLTNYCLLPLCGFVYTRCLYCFIYSKVHALHRSQLSASWEEIKFCEKIMLPPGIDSDTLSITNEEGLLTVRLRYTSPSEVCILLVINSSILRNEAPAAIFYLHRVSETIGREIRTYNLDINRKTFKFCIHM